MNFARTCLVIVYFFLTFFCYQATSPHTVYASEDAAFGIQVIDQETKRGVPLVELETTNHIKFVTDSNGWVAIQDPDLLHQTVWLTVKSHGYEIAKDGFGYTGQVFNVVPGAQSQISIQRINKAERLYRVTGGGIYHDSLQLGKEIPIQNPLITANVTGCDSVMAVEHLNQIYWFWGDTISPKHPIGGNFHITAATSKLPTHSALPHSEGINFQYITNLDGTVKSVAKMPGEGPTWTSAVVTLPSHDGDEHIYASYIKVKNSLTSYQWGFVKWNNSNQQFEEINHFDERPLMFPESQTHTFRHRDAGGIEHVYFTNPFPHLRVAATPEAYSNPEAYEAYTCLALGTTPQEGKLDRDANGALRFSFKKGTPPLSRDDVSRFIDAGVMTLEESPFTIQDPATDRLVQVHNGTVYWNDYLQQWIMIAGEQFGESSYLGEIWFAASSNLNGPWTKVAKILSHDRYSFYNPKQHPFFDEEGGKLIYFEGTFTQSFSNAPSPVPRYEYNQMMYRLDLQDFSTDATAK